MGDATQARLVSAINLMRRLPPQDTEKNLHGLCALLPDQQEELFQRVDQPLKVSIDPTCNMGYIECDYNRDGDSFRSPWSNQFFPPLEGDEGFMPSGPLRELEDKFNTVFDAYRNLYYEGGVGSVYLWDLDTGFAGAFMIRKDVDRDRGVDKGSWNAIHIVDVANKHGKTVQYTLTTTIILELEVLHPDAGSVKLGGYITRKSEANHPKADMDAHIPHIGSLIENMEINLRRQVDELYVQKTREVINKVRRLDPKNPHDRFGAGLAADLATAMAGRATVE
mmetsp:Transcript_58132/g.127421  ORF Transcript_58132/g.127421 Transcript_58132/m.127421 type:complete len:280 (+) Transcript_58132:47-886(+)